MGEGMALERQGATGGRMAGGDMGGGSVDCL